MVYSKLTDINFSDWHHNMGIVLKHNRHVLDKSIPPIPSDNAPQKVIDAYKTHKDYTAACIMLASMIPKL